MRCIHAECERTLTATDVTMSVDRHGMHERVFT